MENSNGNLVEHGERNVSSGVDDGSAGYVPDALAM
jgi:hypothetical protein